MSTRSWLIVGSGALIACGALGVACSSPGYNTDGGVDSGGGGDAKSDVTTKPDGGGTDGGGGDGSTAPCTTTVITGECDIVAQNCPTGKECVATQGSDGGFLTTCVQNGGGSIPEGYVCTSTAQCLPGLECFPGYNRCAKHCCLGNDSECGTAHPEGFAGKCDLNITDNNSQPMYSVCTYNEPCQPFKIQACEAGLACLVQDSQGTADCYGYASPDGGKPEKAACTSANDCNDGLMCLPAQDGGTGSCVWQCYSSASGPYDAGIMNAGPGHGGCPTNETCQLVTWSGNTLPAWLGFCK